MNRVFKIIIAVIAIIAIGIGGIKMMQQLEQDRMVEIVKSEEVEKIIRDDLKSFDKNALTEGGIIKSYKIDYNSISHNPMGGINFTVYVNNDNNLYIFYTINKDFQANKLVNDGGGNSAKFEKLVTGEDNE